MSSDAVPAELSPSAPFVSVILPVRNGAATLHDCLTALRNVKYPRGRHEIVVVDNDSTDGTAAIIRAHPVRAVFEERRGLSWARNRGIAASRGEILAFTDADCSVSRGWLTELLEGFAGDEVDAVTGEVVAYPPRTPAEGYAARRKPLWYEWSRRTRPTPPLLFGSIAVRRAVFDRVGGFDPRFADGGSEDIDYSWRFFRAGLRITHRPKAVVFHRHRTSQGDLFRQHLRYGRGQAMLWKKYPGEIEWGWSAEMAAWRDLGAGLRTAIVAWARFGRGGATNAHYPYFDLVRKLAQRIGFVHGVLTHPAAPRQRRIDAAAPDLPV
jgi:GT2 family glycosyltransferase